MFKRIFLIINLFFILVGCSNNNDIVIDFPEISDSDTVIIVDIKGAVKTPGLYSVEKGVMLYEIINLAGGLLSNADRDGINLIQVFNNNTSINIPYISNNSSSKLININYASIEELMTLNGIGEVKALAIIEYRKETMFNSIEDIMKVSGISESVFNKIKDDITV